MHPTARAHGSDLTTPTRPSQESPALVLDNDLYHLDAGAVDAWLASANVQSALAALLPQLSVGQPLGRRVDHYASRSGALLIESIATSGPAKAPGATCSPVNEDENSARIAV